MTEVAPKMFDQKKMNQIVEISNRNNANKEYLAAHFLIRHQYQQQVYWHLLRYRYQQGTELEFPVLLDSEFLVAVVVAAPR